MLATEFTMTPKLQKSSSSLPSPPPSAPESVADTGASNNHTTGVGTLTYASPEQLEGKEYDEKVDIWSLAIVFFELCYPMSTEMERTSVVGSLRRGVFPEGFQQTHPEEAAMIQWLMHVDPRMRPTAMVSCDEYFL